MIKKNTIYHSEGFKVYDKHFFEVELDVSGFDELLIKKGIEDLNSNAKWFQINGSEVLSADIDNPQYNISTEKLRFNVLKENLIKFRDLTLSEK
jgi:hypothetical protein